uniref:Uncharacterized protein n=1 Tax=Panagrolaimus superbus TaxID=310955 RepID=A0A914Y8W3_9BILA
MRLKYSDAITKYQKQGCNVLSWLLDQVQFEVDFISPPELGLAQLKRFLKDKCSGFICRECFEAKNQEYFNGQLNYKQAKVGFLRKKKEIFECFICDENSKNEFMKNCGEMDDADVGKEIVFRKSLAVLRSTAIKFHPTVTIQFHDSLDPSLPRSIFQYILQNANHQLLSKIYATAKYFFVKQQILLCYRIQISSTSIITFMEQALFTNAKTLLQLPVKKYCCGTTLTFSSDDKGLLSKCLPKLCFCSLTNLIIDGQNLCLDEFMTLLSGGKMEQLSLKEVRIFKEKNEKIMKIEEIFQVLPPTVTDLSIK